MLAEYRQHAAERAALGIPPLPLDPQQTLALMELVQRPPAGEEQILLDLLTHRVPAGVDDAAGVKAEFLARLAWGELASPLVDRAGATELLGTMLGGFNVKPLLALLEDAKVGAVAAEGLKKTLLIFDAFDDAEGPGRPGQRPRQGGAALLGRGRVVHLPPRGAASLTVTIFKVDGEINTDDFSPAGDAWSRPDIPLHALAMRKNARPASPGRPGKLGPLKLLPLKARAIRSPTWATWWAPAPPASPPATPCSGASARTSPACPTSASAASASAASSPRSSSTPWRTPAPCRSKLDVTRMKTGDVVELAPRRARSLEGRRQVIAKFKVKSDVLFDEVRAGGRIPLIIGRALTAKARKALGLPASTHPSGQPDAQAKPARASPWPRRWSGRACGVPGHAPRHLLRAAR